MFEQIEFPLQVVYNCNTKEGGTTCGGEADVRNYHTQAGIGPKAKWKAEMKAKAGVKCGGAVFSEEMGFPKYKLSPSSVVSVTTDPKGQPSKFWNWAINGMKGCIGSIEFGVKNGVSITTETRDAIGDQADRLQWLASGLSLDVSEHYGVKDGKEVEMDLDPERFWKWSNFGLLSCLNFFRWGIENEVPINREHLDEVKAQYLRLGQYIEALEDTVEPKAQDLINEGTWKWLQEMSKANAEAT